MNEQTAGLRQAELVASLSLATDLGTGQPLERGLRTCLLAFRMGQYIGLNADQLRVVYYTALLRFVGCTADARHMTDIFGDELVAQANVATVELLPVPMLAAMVRYAGQGYPLSERLQKLTYGLKSGIARTREAEVAHCEVSQNIARRCGLGDDVCDALGQIFERWDGRGVPGNVKGEALSQAIRLVHVAQDAEVMYRVGGAEASAAIVRKRSGGFFDPAIVDCFTRNHRLWLEELNTDTIWDVVLEIEPAPQLYLSGVQYETALQSIADFTDLRTPYTHQHSSAVAELGFQVAVQCGLSQDDAVQIRHAGYVHDVGRIAVPLSIWDKAGALTKAEIDRVRLYPYYTERILSRSPQLARVGVLASLHKERLDGSGYHRGIPASMLSSSARILAAADTLRSKLESRPYRPALTMEAAVADLLNQVRDGKLDQTAASTVIEVATGKRTSRRKMRVANLSDRELEVLRLLAQGLSTRKIADDLSITPKTADHHVQHIYNKIGVSTRAAATLFAIQNRLLSEPLAEE